MDLPSLPQRKQTESYIECNTAIRRAYGAPYFADITVDIQRVFIDIIQKNFSSGIEV